MTMLFFSWVIQFKPVSWAYNYIFLLTLFVQSLLEGWKGTRIPTIGKSQSQVIGAVLFNFAMANTVPSWVNTKHPKISIHKSVWGSVVFALIFYISTGFFGNLLLSRRFSL